MRLYSNLYFRYRDGPVGNLLILKAEVLKLYILKSLFLRIVWLLFYLFDLSLFLEEQGVKVPNLI